jgi:16S rRNA (adenine1518-N6/adenine1519-N6)-dimethyltransferase
MLSVEQIKETLKEEDLKVLKSLGQNFLVDENALAQIVASAEISSDDVVLEIGPGMGVLTFALAEKSGKVFAIEKDRKMSKFLRQEAEKKLGVKNNIEIICQDILKMNLPEFLEKNNIKKYKLVANIPYYITSPIIKLFLETEIQPETIVVLVQKEVAERICAKKGDLSILALSVLVYGSPEMVGVVGKKSFFPAPKVDSAILKINSIGKSFSDEKCREIFRIIKIGFSAKRKKLAKNLAAGFKMDKNEVEKILESNGIDINVRAQGLDLEDWVRLSNCF